MSKHKNTIKVRFAMGDAVRDRVSGFQGVVTGFSTFITGCDQYLVNPRANPEANEYKSGAWLDDVRLELVQAGRLTLDQPPARLAGSAPEGPPQR